MSQPAPFVVQIVEQPEVARDISIDFVVGMFSMAGFVLLAAAIGSILVACGVVVWRRRQERNDYHPQQDSLGLRQ